MKTQRNNKEISITDTVRRFLSSHPHFTFRRPRLLTTHCKVEILLPGNTGVGISSALKTFGHWNASKLWPPVSN